MLCSCICRLPENQFANEIIKTGCWQGFISVVFNTTAFYSIFPAGIAGHCFIGGLHTDPRGLFSSGVLPVKEVVAAWYFRPGHLTAGSYGPYVFVGSVNTGGRC